jgi:hypothetical protein
VEQVQGTSESASYLAYHDLFTNGIVYLDLGLDLRALPSELLPYAGLFGQALLEIGTETEDFVKLSQRIGRSTGGIYPTTLIAPVVEPEAGERGSRAAGEIAPAPLAAYLMLRGNATLARTPEL